MSSSNIPLFGRAWRLGVKNTTNPSAPISEILSQDSWDPEALRVTFEVLKTTVSSPYWFADIKIYNVNDDTALNLIQSAAWLKLEAGYQYGVQKSSVIWDGPILQIMYGRENVVDEFVRFNCVGTIAAVTDNFVSFPVGPNTTQLQAVSQILAKKYGVASLSGSQLNQQVSPYAQQLLSKKQYPKGKTFAGTPTQMLQQIASDNFLSYFVGEGGADTITELLAPNADQTPDFIYSPPSPPNWLPPLSALSKISQSVLGVPVQNPFGVDFTVLLDPRLQVTVPPMIVQLDRTVIQQMKIQYGNMPPRPLDANLLFVVAQVRHYGDTRGNDWATEVTGFNPLYAQSLLNGIISASAPTSASGND